MNFIVKVVFFFIQLDAFFLIQQTMRFLMPLLVVALGGMFAERSGIINIALEGIMIMGAFTGILFISLMQGALRGGAPLAEMSGQVLLLIAMAISMVTGVIVSLPHAYASIHMKANQIISGTALNMLAPAIATFVAMTINTKEISHVPFVDQFLIRKVPVLGDIPVIGPMLFQNAYLTTYIGFVILFISWVILYKTPFGLRLRSCGEHPQAADSVGVNVYKMRYAGTMISGALAGLGGLIFFIPTSTQYDPNVSGYGFLALAVLIFGQWKPARILFAAFFFGLMQTIAVTNSTIPVLKDLALDSYIYKMIPGIATLIVLALTSRKSMAPKAAGVPYDMGSR